MWMVLQMKATSIFPSICFDCFSVVCISPGSVSLLRGYLDPAKVHRPCNSTRTVHQFVPLKVCHVSQHSFNSMEEVPGDSFSRRAGQSHLRPLTHQQDESPKVTHWYVSGQTIRNRYECCLRASSGSYAHRLAPWSSTGIWQRTQSWQIQHWYPVLFTEESKFTQLMTDEKGSGESMVNIKYDRFGGGSVLGGIYPWRGA